MIRLPRLFFAVLSLSCCFAVACRPACAAAPVHEVKGGGVFFLETGAAQGGNLIEQISINARLNSDGSAEGYISSTIDAITVPATGGHPDPYGTGDPVLYQVTDLEVVGSTAYITTVVVFSPDFPEEEGTVHDFVIEDVGNPPNADDFVSIDGFDLPPLAAGNYVVR